MLCRLQVFENIKRKGCVKPSLINNGSGTDNNWYPRKLIIFQGYCVRFFYLNVEADSNDIFNTGEDQAYDWCVALKKSYTQPVYIIFVSLIEEESEDYITKIDTVKVTVERLVDYNWQKELFPITIPGHTKPFREQTQ